MSGAEWYARLLKELGPEEHSSTSKHYRRKFLRAAKRASGLPDEDKL